jgi:ABC-type uncharacterized transport system substrate-binding protein
MKRRTFIKLMVGAVAASPISAYAQQPTRPLIGFLSNTSRSLQFDAALTAFHRALAEAGYIEGKNAAIEYRFTDGQVDRLPALAAELVNRKVTVLYAVTDAAALAAKAATASIPVVFMIGRDPVELGLVSNLSRPTGNTTGVTSFSTQLEAKRLELLHELVPRATLIAVLANPKHPAAAAKEQEISTAARTLGLRVQILHVSSEGEFDTAFKGCVSEGAGGLLVAGDALFFSRQKEIVALASRYAIPAIYEWRDFVVAGGLQATVPASLTQSIKPASTRQKSFTALK